MVQGGRERGRQRYDVCGPLNAKQRGPPKRLRSHRVHHHRSDPGVVVLPHPLPASLGVPADRQSVDDLVVHQLLYPLGVGVLQVPHRVAHLLLPAEGFSELREEVERKATPPEEDLPERWYRKQESDACSYALVCPLHVLVDAYPE